MSPMTAPQPQESQDFHASPEPQESRARRYTVLAQGPVESLLEIKRSTFIGILARAATEEEARSLIEATRRRYHDARHVCSAFLLGPDREVQRSSDDGEPAGTAGIPMLQALLNRRTGTEEAPATDLSDVCAVVVRYFGGTKLGAGGLVRAYTDAVVQALDASPLVPRARLRQGTVVAPHAEAGRLENELRTAGIRVLGTDYASQAALRLAVEDSPAVQARTAELLAALSSGSLGIAWGGTEWIE